jgi:hypothetical protein
MMSMLSACSAPELGHPVTADRTGLVDSKHPMLVAVEGDRLAPGFEIGGGGMEIGKGRLTLDELEVHQPTGRIVDEYKQRALRAAILNPPMLAAVDLDQFADAVAPVTRLMDVLSPLLAIAPQPGSIIHSRSVSRPSVIPWTSRSFSAANVGPKSQYHSRMIASTALRSASDLHRLLRRPRRFEIRPVGPSVR